MSYTPNNVAVFTAAFTGALAGMAVHNRSNTATSATSPQYVVPENAAGAWAEEFDTAWGATSADTLQLGLIEDGAYAVWANRFPKSTDPAFYASEVNTLIALIIAGENFFAANGIIPPTPGGGAVTLAVAAGHSVVAGHVGMLTPNETVQTATAALLGAPYMGANVAFNTFCIFVTSGTAPARVEIITEGPVDPALVNVGPGLAMAVAFNSSGVPVRANDTTSVSGLHFIGWCNTEGTITLENVRRDFVNVLDFGLDDSGQNACDTANTALINWLLLNPFQRVYFPEGDYLFNSTMGPYPYGTILQGAGTDGPNQGTSGPRLAGKSGTRILCAGTGVGVSVGHIYMSPQNARSGTVLREMTILGRLNNGANRAQPNCITNATNAAPIQITTRSAHGYSTGDLIVVRGVAGNVAANTTGLVGTPITVVDAHNFTIDGSDGTLSGAYTSVSYNVSAAADNTRAGQTALQITTSAAYSIPVGGRVFISGVTGNTNANGELHLEPVPVAGTGTQTKFCLMKASDGVSPAGYVVSNGVYAGGGTVVYGGHCLKTSGINEIGVELGSDGDLHVEHCRIGGFKYPVSFDGCENCAAENMDMEGVSWDIGGQGYMDTGLELGMDSSCNARVGDVKFGLGGSTNGNRLTVTNLNQCRWGALVFDPLGFFMSGGGSELQGGIAIVIEPNNVVFEKFACEGSRVANFLCIGFSGASSVQGMAIRDFFPSQTAPLIWCYGLTTFSGQSSSITGLEIGQVYCNGMTAFPPIIGMAFVTDFFETVPGLCRSPSGTYAGQLGDSAGGGVGNTITGFPINYGLAPKASLHMRGGNIDFLRGDIGGGFAFIEIGTSNNYPFASNQSTVARSQLHSSYSPNTGYQSGGRIMSDGWANVGSGAGAANYCGVVIPNATSDPLVTGYANCAVLVTMTVCARWGSDITKCARWQIVQLADMTGGTVTMLGTPTTVYSEDLAGAYTPPTIVADNSASPGSVAAHITGYAAQATQWTVSWDIRPTGV